MATKKPATPKPPYHPTLVAKWAKIADKAVKTHYASIRDVDGKPGQWEALAAAFEAGDFAPEAVWHLGDHVADRVPPRFARAVLSAMPESYTSSLGAWSIAAVLLARALRETPTALDGFEARHAPQRRVADLALAEAGLTPDGAPAATRAALGLDWTAGGSRLAALALEGGAVVRVAAPEAARAAAVRDTARRLFGPTLTDDLAQAHRDRLAARLTEPTYGRAFPLYASDDALRLAAPALRSEEVSGYQSTFAALAELSAAWSVDDMLRAAEAAQTRALPDAYMLENSLALLAVARDPASAPRAERFLNLADHTNNASPSAGYALAVLLRAPAPWRRHFAAEVVFGRDGSSSVFSGPIALALLADVDPDEGERLAKRHGNDVDFTRLNGADPAVLLALLDAAGPRVREGLLLPIYVAYGHPGTEAPTSLDAHFAFDGTYRDTWISGYLLAIPEARAVEIVRREVAAGRAVQARKALAARGGDALLAAATG
jgi:hypothetical protein